jgi:membrane-bound ClpP family serine protease
VAVAVAVTVAVAVAVATATRGLARAMTLTPGVGFINARAVRRARVRLLLLFAASILATAAHGLAVASPAAAAPPRVLAIRFGPDLEVNPATKDYLNHQLDTAAKHYDAAVIELDTPGGLSSSLRSIYQKELALKVPVIVYVSPSGA